MPICEVTNVNLVETAFSLVPSVQFPGMGLFDASMDVEITWSCTEGQTTGCTACVTVGLFEVSDPNNPVDLGLPPYRFGPDAEDPIPVMVPCGQTSQVHLMNFYIKGIPSGSYSWIIRAGRPQNGDCFITTHIQHDFLAI